MPTQIKLSYGPLPQLQPATTVVVLGRKHRLAEAPLVPQLGISEETWAAMLDATKPGDAGAHTTTWVGARKVVVGVLPEVCSRHNSPSRAWAVPGIAKLAKGDQDAVVVALVDEAAHATAVCNAIARALPMFDRNTGSNKTQTVHITALAPDGAVEDRGIPLFMDSVRMAASLYDTPPADLNTTAFVNIARAVARECGAEITVIEGEALKEQGFGGLWGVGKAATHPPALVALHHKPANPVARVAWVGKGIVYDTGGLSIKSKTGMPGMKGDMGGAAAVLGAFRAAALGGASYELTAVLCLAENAVGPESTRPDDILRMRSGKTVEINNTDAEGRLVLADGVAWVCEQGPLDLLVDMATLTGAQLVATGKVHAALYCNDAAVEARAIEVGRAIGEPCHPLPYAPELFRKEFKSHVADMKNSVKDRANAQSSCAGQFVGNHLPADPPRWLHVDIAGPSGMGEGRGTGYGVGLLVALGACR